MQARCQCGKLTATVADGAEAMTIMCHCLDCQRRTGSPYGAIAYFPAEAVTVAGTAHEFGRRGDAGHLLTRGFCPECGSTIYVKASRLPEITGVPVGALENPAFPAPIRSVYERSRHHWVTTPDGVTNHPQGRDSAW